MSALQDMKKQGKVRWIGASTFLPSLPTFLEWGVFDTFQIPYSALERDHEGWITKSAEAGIESLSEAEWRRVSRARAGAATTAGASSKRPDWTS